MPFTIVRQDITKMTVDAIVNAANTDLKMGGGVCGAIFKAAGAKEMQAACDALAPIETGDVRLTPGFDLPAKAVIHAAGPVYDAANKSRSEVLLRSTYRNALKLAAAQGFESIAFPLIASGIYGYPKGEALQVAISEIQDFLTTHDLDVYVAVFDAKAFQISEALLGDIEAFIDEHYVETHTEHRRELLRSERRELKLNDRSMTYKMPASFSGIDELVQNLDASFTTTLLQYIDAKGMTDVEVYKRANIDRKHFSKIRNDQNYTPSKRTAIALAVSLELTIEETDDLLRRAGYALSNSQKFDVILSYFIIKGIYDPFTINGVLFAYELPLLGG